MSKGRPNILVIQADQVSDHCLRADKVYSRWPYQNILGYRIPQEQACAH